MARINVPITDELDRELNSLIPWGIKAAVFRGIAERLVVILRKDGIAAVESLIHGDETAVREVLK